MGFKLDKSIVITIILVATILFGLNMVLDRIGGTENVLTVSGTSSIKVVPDLVSINFNIEGKGQTMQEAKDQSAQVYDDFKTKMIGLGFKEEELKTTNYNVYENYEWTGSRSVQNGYISSQQIVLEISLNDSKKAGDAISQGIDAGARVSYMEYKLTTESQNKYKAEAMKLAAQDAKSKAEAVAQGFGKKVGKLISTTTSEYSYSPWRNSMDMASGSFTKEEISLEIQPNEQEIYASITARYEMK